MAEKRVKRHMELCEYLNGLYAKKNHDYGNSFAKGFVEHGMIMPVIRMEDKLNRVKNLMGVEKQQITDENIRDSLMDLANYALMTVIEMDISQESYVSCGDYIHVDDLKKLIKKYVDSGGITRPDDAIYEEYIYELIDQCAGKNKK